MKKLAKTLAVVALVSGSLSASAGWMPWNNGGNNSPWNNGWNNTPWNNGPWNNAPWSNGPWNNTPWNTGYNNYYAPQGYNAASHAKAVEAMQKQAKAQYDAAVAHRANMQKQFEERRNAAIAQQQKMMADFAASRTAK